MTSTRTKLWLAAACGAAIALSYALIFLTDRQTLLWLIREDGVFENLSALAFLGASVCFAILFARTRNVFFALLALLFFFGFGEEISWGQRLFHIETPEAIERINAQKELNIHNLEVFHRLEDDKSSKTGLKLWLNFDRLFSLFWLSYCVLVPLLVRVNGMARSLASKIRLPIVALAIGWFFPVNYAVAKALEVAVAPELWHEVWRLVEIKEFLFAFLFMMVGAEFLTASSRRA